MIVSANADYVTRLNTPPPQPQRAFYAFLRHFRESGLRAGNRLHLRTERKGWRQNAGIKWRVLEANLRQSRSKREPREYRRIEVCIYLRDKPRSAPQLLQHQRTDVGAFLADRRLLADQSVVLDPERQVTLKGRARDD